jgi:hypothetical protein
MNNNKLETKHNLWSTIVAKALACDKFKAELLKNTDEVLDQEQKILQKNIVQELINDPDKMEEVFGNENSDKTIDMDVLEERLAAFGYIGF